MNDRKAVLITGCSTGLGRDFARSLSAAGYAVAATARREADLEGVDARMKLGLDVTDADSIEAAVRRVVDELGGVDVLINNAGISVQGAIEEVPDAAMRRMFDVNVFGVMGMVKAVVPIMRSRGRGRIVNVGSIGGRWSMGLNGGYAASKFAIEGLSDALRQELRPFGIDVILIEPGPLRTKFMETAARLSRPHTSDPASPYARLNARHGAMTVEMRKNEAGPEAVSRIVRKAIEAPRPRARYLAAVPFPVRLMLVAGDRIHDAWFESTFAKGAR